MKVKRTNPAYTAIKKHKIYAIIHKKTSSFFLGITVSDDLTSIFSSHYSMRNEYTKELFKEYRETIDRPIIFVLQEIECTLSEAKSREISFAKYFIENGYACLNNDYLTEQSEDLSEYTESIYQDIAAKPLEEYLSKSNQILLNYGLHRSDENKNKYDEGKKQICIRVSDEEYEIIKKQAAKNKLTLTTYMTEVALQGKVINIDYDIIRKHTDEISRTKQLILKVIELFAKVPEIYESDIQRLVDLQTSITQSEKQLLNDFIEHTDDIKKFIKKELRK